MELQIINSIFFFKSEILTKEFEGPLEKYYKQPKFFKHRLSEAKLYIQLIIDNIISTLKNLEEYKTDLDDIKIKPTINKEYTKFEKMKIYLEYVIEKFIIQDLYFKSDSF